MWMAPVNSLVVQPCLALPPTRLRGLQACIRPPVWRGGDVPPHSLFASLAKNSILEFRQLVVSSDGELSQTSNQLHPREK